MLTEKHRFRKAPFNYAMRKTQLMKEREMANNRNDEEEAERLTKELAELEERADMLSKRPRSQTMSTISFINERNRKQNVERAEEAIMEEIRASGGQKSDDPFTRRSTKPRMNHKPVYPGEAAAAETAKMPPPGSLGLPVDSKGSGKDKASTPVAPGQPKPKTNDLFSAHDFDIKIEFDVPLPCEF